jgi:beta-aspartyl-peptidase (threonine type)
MINKLFSEILFSAALFCVLLSFTSCETRQESQVPEKPSEAMSSLADKPLALVIHGGAGTIRKENMSPEMEAAYREKLQEALDVGYAVLETGGTSVEAIRKTINIMEDSPLFNAGKGAVFNSIGKHELDASIMEGHTLNAGAVAGVTRIRNPIDAAILVKDSTRHVMLSGAGAEQFVSQYGIDFVETSYFDTDTRFEQLKKAQGMEKAALDHSSTLNEEHTGRQMELIDDHKYGTVGCVALDQYGNLAAGTSTGGMTNKKFGRIGDSPIIGAGNYANNKSCGVSCTGTGEFFIRTLAAHEASDLMLYQGMNVGQALEEVIRQIAELGGDGGMIALDKDGNVAWDFNTAGMYRGYKKSTGENVIEIYEKTK